MSHGRSEDTSTDGAHHAQHSGLRNTTPGRAGKEEGEEPDLQPAGLRPSLRQRVGALSSTLWQNRILAVQLLLAAWFTTAMCMSAKLAVKSGFTVWQCLLLKYIIDMIVGPSIGWVQTGFKWREIFRFPYWRSRDFRLQVRMAGACFVIQSFVVLGAGYMPLAQLAAFSYSWMALGKMVSKLLVGRKITRGMKSGFLTCTLGIAFLAFVQGREALPGVVAVVLSATTNGWKYFHQEKGRDRGDDKRTSMFYASCAGVLGLSWCLLWPTAPDWPPIWELHNLKLIGAVVGFGVLSELLYSAAENRVQVKSAAVVLLYILQLPSGLVAGHLGLGEPMPGFLAMVGIAIIAKGALQTYLDPNGHGNGHGHGNASSRRAGR